MENIYETIARRTTDMSKSQKKIANYILDHPSAVSFMNVNELAHVTKVSEATIIRFATFLGYKGYPQLQKDLQKQTQRQLTMSERLNMSYETYDDQESGVMKVFDDDINRLKVTIDNLDFDKFFSTVAVITKARRIFISAGRSAVSLGHFMYYYLNMMLGNVTLVGETGDYEQNLCELSNEDVVIGITFSRYTRHTCELISYAYEAGATTVCITDYLTSPIIKNSSYYLLAEASMPSYLDSFIAPLTLINAILTYVGKEKAKTIENRLDKLGHMWDTFQTFY